MFCQNCGQRIAADSAFCISCGKPTQVPSTRVSPAKEYANVLTTYYVKRANPALLLTLLIGSSILCVIGYIMVLIGSENYEDSLTAAGVILIIISVIGIICGVILLWIYVYRMWAMIQNEFARATPGKAVGFMFIPFFGFYWAFQAIWGWAIDYNNFVETNSLEAPRMTEGLFLAWPILLIASAVPCLGYIAALPQFVINIMVIIQICKAINAFYDLQFGLENKSSYIR